MKKLIGSDIGQYVFNPASKTITFLGLPAIVLEQVLTVFNVTAGAIIYSPISATTNGTMSGNVLTLTFNTASQSTSDRLLIYVDLPGTAGSTTATVLPDTEPSAVRVIGRPDGDFAGMDLLELMLDPGSGVAVPVFGVNSIPAGTNQIGSIAQAGVWSVQAVQSGPWASQSIQSGPWSIQDPLSQALLEVLRAQLVEMQITNHLLQAGLGLSAEDLDDLRQEFIPQSMAI